MFFALAATTGAAEDPGARALQQNQLQRQHQQDQLQLKLQQYQRGVANPPADARQRQAIEQLELDQALRQQQLQMQQQRAFQARPEVPSDDPGTRDAKAQLDQQRARQESRRQLEQFDWELGIKAEEGRMKVEGSKLPGTTRQGTGALAP